MREVTSEGGKIPSSLSIRHWKMAQRVALHDNENQSEKKVDQAVIRGNYVQKICKIRINISVGSA